MGRILTSGSLAYDHLYSFQGVFQDELLDHKKGSLSIAFNVKNKAVFFGGCAGNIAFNAKLLNEDFILLGIVGRDFGDYKTWLEKHGVSAENVIIETNEYTAQASVVTDQMGQQITFFHEGAAAKSAGYREEIKKRIAALKQEISLAIVSPNNRDFMLASIEACRKTSIPFFFDPGQAMPLFSKSELHGITAKALGVMLNEYELAMILQRMEIDLKTLLKICRLAVVTLGNKGSDIYFNGEKIHINPGKPKTVKDPTGCGDAYRAGFLIAIKDDFQKLTPEILKRAGDLGTKLATACLQTVGTQNHGI